MDLSNIEQQLFDISKAIGEYKNISDSNSKDIARIHERLSELQNTLIRTQTNLDSLIEKFRDLENVSARRTGEHHQVDLCLNKIQSDIANIVHDISELKEHSLEIDRKCQQNCSKVDKEIMETKGDENKINQSITNLKQDMIDLEHTNNELRSEIDNRLKKLEVIPQGWSAIKIVIGTAAAVVATMVAIYEFFAKYIQ